MSNVFPKSLNLYSGVSLGVKLIGPQQCVSKIVKPLAIFLWRLGPWQILEIAGPPAIKDDGVPVMCFRNRKTLSYVPM